MDAVAPILAAVDPLLLLLVWLAVLAAAVLRAFTGFGFGLAAVPVFSLLMAPSQAVVLSSSLTLAVSLVTVRSYWGVYPVRPLVPMLAAALLGTALGVWLLGRLNVEQFQLWLGLAVVGTCLLLTRYRPRRREAGPVATGSAGLFSGVLNGAFAIPGPPIIVYAMATQDDPAKSRSLLLTFFLFSAALALVFYAVAGFVTPASPWLFALALPAMLIGDRLGQALFSRFADRFYRRIALLVLFAVGLFIALNAVF